MNPKVFAISILAASVVIVLGTFIYSKVRIPQPIQQPVNQSVNQSVDKVASIEATPAVVCKRFTSLEEALKEPNIACVLDLSGQGLSSVPNDIKELTKLNEISLANNKLTEFPMALTTLHDIRVIDLSDNQISQVPKEIGNLRNLYSIDLSNNKVTSFPIEEFLTPPPGEKVTQASISVLKIKGTLVSALEKNRIKELVNSLQIEE